MVASRNVRRPSVNAGDLEAIRPGALLFDEEMPVLDHTTTAARYARGQRILTPDGPPDQIHFILSGLVRVYRMTSGGKRLTLDVYGEGALLGHSGLVGQSQSTGSFAEAIDETLIWTMSHHDLSHLIERKPIVSIHIISQLSRRLGSAERKLEVMAFHRVQMRLADRLLDLARQFGLPSERGTVIHMRLSHEELADMIGSTRETVTHALGGLRRLGLVETAHQTVTIRQVERLTTLAAGP